MKKITTLLPKINFNIVTLWLLTCLLFISACSQGNKDESTSISVSLPAATMAQLTNPTSIGGDLNGITRVIISVYFDNNRTGAAIASGDILAAGGNLKLSVIPNTDLYITGKAYDSQGQEQLSGETTIAGLPPGSNVGVAFTLQAVGAQLKPISGVITTAGTIGTIEGSDIRVIRVVDGVETTVAQGIIQDGAYNLQIPDDLVPGSDIIFRVDVYEDGEPVAMEARYTSEVVNINPITHAVSRVVSSIAGENQSNLGLISVEEMLEIQRVLDLISIDLGPQSGSTIQAYSDVLVGALEADLETTHIASSAVAGGSICGTVMDNTEAPLQGIVIIVREFGSRILRARTISDAQGDYCVNVPYAGETDVLTGATVDGDYIIGAINQTRDNFAASQWWTSLENTVSLRIEAGKISLNNEVPDASADFLLSPGTRIEGTVTADSTTEPLAGVNVMVREKTTQYLLVGALTNADGEYVLNVPVGEYIVETRNETSKPYASETFTTDGAGSPIRNLGSVISPTASTPFTANFSLLTGNTLTGIVTENQAAITGVRMFINDSNFGAATRLLISKRDGSYQVWMRPGTYDVYGYGQNGFADISQGSLAQPIAFTSSVAKLPIVVQHNAANVSKAKVRLYEEGEGPSFRSMDFSKSDGTAMLYSDFNGSHLVEARIEGQESYSSIIYLNQLTLGAGDSVVLTAGQTAPAVTVALQNAGWLTGTVVDVDGNFDGNAVISVFPQSFPGGYSRLTFTRTSGDGRFALSLPQGTYSAIRISASFGVVDCLDVPVIVGDTTDLLIEDSGDGIFCSSNQTPPTLINVAGSVTTNGLDSVLNDSLVQLIEIDASGNPVGDAVSFGAVQNGEFTLSVPDTLPAESRYVARVQTATGQLLQAHLTDLTSLDLSPITTAASSLVLNYSNINEVNAAEIVEIERTLKEVELVNDLSGATTLADYISQLETTFLADLETANILTSSFSQGTICGQVQDVTGTALTGISIEVRDFSTETLRATALTDASGNYCVNVPVTGTQDPVSTQVSNGEYILGAINRTDTSFAASEWWTAAGNGYMRIKGGKIPVPSTAIVTANFTLEPGARLFGHIGALDLTGTAVDLPGVKVSILDSITHLLIAEQTTQQDGSFIVNVYPGDYLVEAQNSTFRPYASATYTLSNPGGSNLRNEGTVVPVTANTSTEVNLTLDSAAMQLSGRVAEGADPTTGLGGTPVTGIPVLVTQDTWSFINGTAEEGPPVTRIQVTNLDGRFKVWLAPDVYDVFTYGQISYADMSQLDHFAVFPDSVATLPVTVLHNSVPVSGAKVRLYGPTEGYDFWGDDISRSDGTATVYSNQSGGHVVQIRIEENVPYASVYYGGVQEIYSATTVSLFTGSTAPGITVDLPNGGILSGFIGGFGTPAPPQVNLLVGITINNDFFVATRTNSDGRYRISLPESVYEPQFHFAGFYDVCFDRSAGVPVILNETTTMDVTTGDGSFCSLTIPPLTLGTVTFDRTYSHDTTAHALNLPTLNNWPMTGYDFSTGTPNSTTRSYTFNKMIVDGVPVTFATETIDGVPIETEALAVATDGAMYAIVNANAILFLPATLTTGFEWTTPDGTNTVINTNEQSPAGYTGTIHIVTTYNDNSAPWHTYLRTNQGILDEWEELAIPEYYRRTDIAPENPPIAGAGIVP